MIDWLNNAPWGFINFWILITLSVTWFWSFRSVTLVMRKEMDTMRRDIETLKDKQESPADAGGA